MQIFYATKKSSGTDVEVAVISEEIMDFKMISYTRPNVGSFILVVKKPGPGDTTEYFRKPFIVDYNEDPLEVFYNQELDNLADLIGTSNFEITQNHGYQQNRIDLGILGFDLNILDSMAEDDGYDAEDESYNARAGGMPDFNSPRTQALEEAIRRCQARNNARGMESSSDDPPITVYYGNCNNAPPTGGFFKSFPFNYREAYIKICANSGWSDEEMEMAYQHELQHAYDHCMGRDNSGSGCNGSIATELNAYYCMMVGRPDEGGAGASNYCEAVSRSSAAACGGSDAAYNKCMEDIGSGALDYPPSCAWEDEDQNGTTGTAVSEECDVGGPGGIK